MALELRGNVLVERSPTRRWVSIVAVVIPVAAFVMLSAWFIRVFVAPPTIAIPNPMMLADTAPTAPSSVPVRAQVEAPKQQFQQQSVATAEPAASLAEAAPEPAPVPALPMLATLAVAPPTLGAAPHAFADPAQDTPTGAPSDPPSDTASSAVSPPAQTMAAAESAAVEPSEPIAGPVPLPRVKPRVRIALAAHAVPLPRPRPVEAAPPPDLPEIDRHAPE